MYSPERSWWSGELCEGTVDWLLGCTAELYTLRVPSFTSRGTGHSFRSLTSHLAFCSPPIGTCRVPMPPRQYLSLYHKYYHELVNLELGSDVVNMTGCVIVLTGSSANQYHRDQKDSGTFDYLNIRYSKREVAIVNFQRFDSW